MIMRLSTKGQVTIPQEIREQAGIGPGSAVDIEFRDGDIHLLPRPDVTPSRGRALVERIRASGVRPLMSTDDLMALTRGED